MGSVKQPILYSKSGLDSDTAQEYIQMGDSPWRFHVIHGVDGNNGVIENMKGNHLASYELKLSNCYQVVGSHYDKLARKAYYLIFSQPYDSTGLDNYIYDNHLLCFDENTEIITNIFTDKKNYFGISSAHPVKDCDMVEDILYFNPRTSEPKMIDVVMARNYTETPVWEDSPVAYIYGAKVRFFGGVFVANTAILAGQSPSTHPLKWNRVGNSYQEETDLSVVFDSEFRYAFNVIRQTPVYRPQCVYGTDTNKKANNVRGKIFRFALRYKFWDDTYSRFGAYSDAVLPQYDEYYNGEVPDALDLFNYIRIDIGLHSASLIKEIEIIFQETSGKWKLAKKINRREQSLLNAVNYSYKFYNNDPSYDIIADALFTEVYDSVPRTAGTQELINKNILTYGRCKEGFPNVDKDKIDITLTPEVVPIIIDKKELTGGRYRDNTPDWTIKQGQGYALLELNFITWYPYFGMAAGDLWRIQINSTTVTYTVKSADIAPINTFVTAIGNWLKTQFPLLASGISITGNPSITILTAESINIGMSIFYQPGGGPVALTKKTGFKTGSWHPFCIYYYGEGMRRWDAQTSKANTDGTGYSIKGTSVYVPSLSELAKATPELITNGTFDTASGWTLGSANWAWTTGTNVMTRVANADLSTLSQSTPSVSGATYRVSYVLTRTAGTITPSLGGIILTARSLSGTYEENVVCGTGANAPIIFSPDAAFAGTIDNVSTHLIIDTANRFKINWSINHLPPEGAKWWRWGYADNALCSYMVQYPIKAITAEGQWVKMDISPLQTIKTTVAAGWNQFPQSIIDPYEWVKGDRVRIITKASVGTIFGDVVDTVSDFEILKYEETPVAVPAVPIDYFIYTQNFAITGLGKGSIIEIYRPIKTETKQLFYEFGDIMPILVDANGVRVHGSGAVGIQNQDTSLTLPAMGVFEHGGIYHLLRTPSQPVDTIKGHFMESRWYSDFYNSNDWDKGRPGVETSFGERTLNIIRYSNQYLQNTGINGLSTFEALNYKELSDMFGAIVGMVEVGNTLKVYMEKKPASILIGRQEYQDANGALTTASSDRVLGSVRYSENSFGTQFLESITKNNRFVYFYDAYNGVICRDSANGVFPISGRYEEAGTPSDYRMETWFRDKSEALVKSGLDHVSVVTVFDERYKCLYVCFRDLVNNNNDDTIVFHEPSNRWITYADFTQTPKTGYNVMLELDYSVVLGFETGIGFEFDQDTRFAKFNIGLGNGTTTSESVFPLPAGLVYTIYDPDVNFLGAPSTDPATSVSANGFLARWGTTEGAVAFYLDVATDSLFVNMVTGYNNRPVGNVLLYPVTGLDGRLHYYYQVRAVDVYNNVSDSSDPRIVDVTLGATFIRESTNLTDTSFTANWNVSVTATGYRISVSLYSDFRSFVGVYNNLDVFNVTQLNITGLTAGVLYWYQVTAYNPFQTSTVSNINWQTPSLPPPIPVPLNATEITAHSFKMNWQGSQGASNYGLEVAADINFTDYKLNTPTGLQDPNYRVVSGLAPLTTYWYRVSAYNAYGGESDPSLPVSVRTLSGSPVALNATNFYSHGFRANWYTIPGTVAYYIDVATDANFSNKVKDNVNAGNGGYYDVTGLLQLTVYYYQIRAYDGNYTTDNSNPILQATGAEPSVPVALAPTVILSNGFTARNGGSVVGVTGFILDVANNIDFAPEHKVVGYDNKDLSWTGNYDVIGLAASTAYYYRLMAYADYGGPVVYSIYSDPMTVVTRDPATPDPPTATPATLIGTTGFTANWNVQALATGYRLYITQDPRGIAPFILGYDGLDVGNVLTFVVTGLQPQRGYFYRVAAYNGITLGSLSNNIITAYTNALPLPTISLSPSTWNFGGQNINKTISVSVTEATSWGVSFPSLNGRIHEYARGANSTTLYYSGAFGTGDSLTFYATGAGGTTTIIFNGRWT